MRTRFDTEANTVTALGHDPNFGVDPDQNGPFIWCQHTGREDGRWYHVADLKAENREDLEVLADPKGKLPPAPANVL